MAVMDSAGGTADDTIRRTLKLVFGLVPIVAGLDKFTDLLVQWDKYLAPPIAHLLPMTPRFFMHLVGIIEIVAGVGVLLTPWTRLFAWIVALWLLGIALNLVIGGYYDIAVRDIVMAISAFCLARLSASGVTRQTFVAPGTAAPWFGIRECAMLRGHKGCGREESARIAGFVGTSRLVTRSETTRRHEGCSTCRGSVLAGDQGGRLRLRRRPGRARPRDEQGHRRRHQGADGAGAEEPRSGAHRRGHQPGSLGEDDRVSPQHRRLPGHERGVREVLHRRSAGAIDRAGSAPQ